jgi:hypothetical protein
MGDYLCPCADALLYRSKTRRRRQSCRGSRKVMISVFRVPPRKRTSGASERMCLRTSRETANLWVSQKRTSAAEAVKHRRFTARLKPCPSYRDAFSFSFLAVAPRRQFVQNVPSQPKAVKHVCRAIHRDFFHPLFGSTVFLPAESGTYRHCFYQPGKRRCQRKQVWERMHPNRSPGPGV